jgi:heme/copper-type cytochrome/quinol oxidase subunit 1
MITSLIVFTVAFVAAFVCEFLSIKLEATSFKTKAIVLISFILLVATIVYLMIK